ncbi:MAG: YbaB/EbfC family nucleoid-associated protein [Oscillospiraceae bacterium]|nr:YbaB/EbfC family nucleoid-associated protein [Oscillospiraceae bacterium]
MAKGGFPGRKMGGGIGGSMMRQQAQMQQKLLKMQKDIEKAQEEVEATLYTATVGGGAVKAVCSGKKELHELTISPELLGGDDVEMVQDMIMSAVNEALRQADDAMTKTMDGISSGMNLGAFGL